MTVSPVVNDSMNEWRRLTRTTVAGGALLLGVMLAGPAHSGERPRALEELAMSPQHDARTLSPGGAPALGLDLELRIGTDELRLVGRILGLATEYGAWLNGLRRPDGFSFDGGILGERTWEFRLDGDVRRRDPRRWPGVL
jgi:hypothetical protein